MQLNETEMTRRRVHLMEQEFYFEQIQFMVPESHPTEMSCKNWTDWDGTQEESEQAKNLGVVTCNARRAFLWEDASMGS